MKISKLFALTLLLTTFSAYAEDELKDPLEGLTVSPEEISKSLDNMHASGKINAEDYAKAKAHLSKMSANDVNIMNQTALGIVRNNPDKAVELTKGKMDAAAVESQIKDLSQPKD